MEIHLVRHGQTDWNISGQHTGRTDLLLNERGREESRGLRTKLVGTTYDRVWVSPLARARETCDLAGYGDRAEVWDDLMEWNYGAWEGRTKAEISATHPGWDQWTDGAPQGEDVPTITTRMERVVARLSVLDGTTLVFAHGHMLRCLACRWVGWPIAHGRRLILGNCALSILGGDVEGPTIRAWNI